MVISIVSRSRYTFFSPIIQLIIVFLMLSPILSHDHVILTCISPSHLITDYACI